MEERLARLEGSYDGTKQSQIVLITALVGLGAAVLAAFAVLLTVQIETRGEVGSLRRDIAALNEKVNALPTQIAESVRESNRAFSEALNTSLQLFRQAQQPPAEAPTQQPPQAPKPR